MLLLVEAALAVAGAGRLVHRVGDRVGDEEEGELGVGDVGQRPERLDHEAGVGTDEGGPQRIRADLVDLEDQLVGALGEGVGEVLAVLPAGGVRRVGAGRHDDDPVQPASGGVPEGVREERRRVAVAPEDGDLDLALLQLGLEGGDEGAVLVVDRAAAAEQLVVVRDVLEPLVRDPAARGHPAQERHDLVGRLRAAERQEEDGVVGRQRLGGHRGSPRRNGCGALRWSTIATIRIPNTSAAAPHTTNGEMKPT